LEERVNRRDNRDRSPDGRWSARIEDDNVVIRDRETGAESRLSSDGTAEFPYRPRFAWSPDSTRLVALQEQVGEQRQIHLIESSPEDQLQPKLHTLNYAKPGDRLAQAKPRLFDVTTKRQIPISEDLFPNPWSISDLHWQPDSRRFMFLYNQRGHQLLRVVVVDATTGEAAKLIDEASQTFVDYAGKKYLKFLDSTHEIVWMSERDGWNHLYLYDSRTGQVKNQITKGPWVVRNVDRIDEQARQVWFRAGGIYPEQDPYYVHYCRVNLDGSGLVVLTSGNGTHDVQFSPDRKYLIDAYSRVDLPTITELRRADGEFVCKLERGDWSALLEAGWQPPERFVAKGRDEVTDIFGIIHRPTTFDPAKKYPVIEKIYAGPHSSFVPKRFAAYRSEQANTELGFVIVQIDGMGTSHRSKAFHDVCWKNLGDSGFPDRIAWLNAAAKKYPYLDLERVGIYGGSAGGQSAVRALLAHGDFYKVAVADCGCHDNRMDKVWWNELWMGWPIGPHYAEQSNVTNAHRLTGQLLLTLGELDRNVDPSSTMQVVNALIKADKDFDFLLIPGAGHGAGEMPYGKRRRRDFFVRHLLGVEPRRK
jgi:dipeptidyl aminopeptidase/acylaminoacyl peptidase